MRFLHWERSPHSNIHRSRSKRGHLFGIHSLASWYYNAERRNFMASRIRQFAKRQSLKLKYLKNPSNRGDQINLVKINELRLVHNLLLAELIQLERKLKKRSQSIVNAMHRYRKGVEELRKLEELIARKRESLNFAKRKIKLSLTKEGCAEKGNEKTTDECKPFVKAEKERSLGGDDRKFKFRVVNPNALILKYFRKWLTKAKIIHRESNGRDSHDIVMPENKQRVRLETDNIPDTFLIDSVTNMENNIEYDDETPHQVTTSSSSQIYISYLNLKRESAKSAKREKRLSNKSKFSRYGGKSRQNRISGVAGQRRSQRSVKRKKRRKSHKNLESTPSDMADRRTSRKGSRKRKIRRKSNKSIRRTLSDLDITRQRSKEAKRRRSRKRVESNEKGLLQEQSLKSEANLDENTISSRVSRKYAKRNRRKSKRKSVEDRRWSELRGKDKQNGSPSNNDDKLKDGSLKVDIISNGKMGVDFSGKQIMKESETKSIESASKSVGSVSQFSTLEKYWGVSLRHSHDNTLDRMEALSSVLDDLLQMGTPKMATTQATTEKTITHQQTREINDLHKLFILLKECEEYQRQQGIGKSFENKNQHSDFLAMAAGLPDCLPDDFHISCETICSCNM